MNGGKFFKVFEKVIQKSRALKKKSSFSILLYGNLPESGVCYYPYSLLNSWLFLSFAPCVHRVWIQVRILLCSLLSFPDHFSLVFSWKRKEHPVSLKPTALQVMSPAFPPSVQFCLQTTPWPHCLSFDSNSHLFVGSLNIHKRCWSFGSFTPSLPMVLPFIWLQSPAPRVRLRAFWWPRITTTSLKLSF